MPDVERWRATWHGLGVETGNDDLYAMLIARYAEPHRRYHTARHLGECFARLDEARSLAAQRFEIELALWFHDAVYDVHRPDNEERSAAWAQEAAEGTRLPAAVGERVRQLILATKHDALPPSADAALLVDVDLAILGAAAERFDEYERQIREEYAWVPDLLFGRKRRDILQGFLARPHIYNTSHFRDRFEAAARANLSRSIAQLGGRPKNAMPSSSELALRVVAEREPGSRIWSFYLVNDGAGAIGASELAAVRYEWGDQYVGGESPATKIASIGSGGRALIWRDDGSSEMRTDLWVRVTHDCQEAWLVFAFPRLYRQTGTSLVAVASRMPGPPGALP